MNVEDKVVTYLELYGNTREIDLINFGTLNLRRSPENMKRIIDRMAVKGKIHHIVHNKLKPPQVYLTLEEPSLPDTIADREIFSEEVERILREAASIAEHRRTEGNPKT